MRRENFEENYSSLLFLPSAINNNLFICLFITSIVHKCKIIYQKFCSRRRHLFLNTLHDVSSCYSVMTQRNQEPIVRQSFATTWVVPMFADHQNTLFQLSIQHRKITKCLSSCNIYRQSVTNARVLTT